MLNSNAVTRPAPPAEQPADPATRAWRADPARDPDPPVPTLALPSASTPSPNGPERATMPESTEHMATARAAAPSELPPIPGYAVEVYVGRGGMGVVYRATHAATGRVVALKLTNPGGAGDSTTRERFVREVRALAALKHTNIVPLYDAGEWHGFAYCTMEYVPGGNLNEHLERIRADLPAAVVLMAKVTRAVEFLHAHKIIHRDLKPLNILIADNDEPMVADFGLARWTDDDSDLTRTGLPVGTRQYMSPEQTLGMREHYTAACDVWALGVTLYELLTGHRPFLDDGVTDVYHSIRTADPPPMTALSADVPAPLQAVVSKCLAKAPENRYPTAAALADDLERYLRDEPVSVPLPDPAPPVGPPAPVTVKKSRRGRMLRMAGAAAVLAVLAVFFFRKPAEADEQPPADPEPAKPALPLAERLAAGEKVKLTDDKGRPTGALWNEPGHELHPGEMGEFHSFASVGVGIASFSDTPIDGPYRVTADVAIAFQTAPARAGFYVGRRTWPDLTFKHESLLWAGVSPTTDPRDNTERRLKLCAELYWWGEKGGAAANSIGEELTEWYRGEKRIDAVRFAHVAIEVHNARVTADVDGSRVGSWTDPDLTVKLTEATKRIPAPGFPDYKFGRPAIGAGIGIFCQDGRCVVRNMTVSRLDP